jgi:hypothetical protein
VETYLQILNPAYRVSLGFQKNCSTIADIIPFLLQIIELWNQLDLSVVPKAYVSFDSLCDTQVSNSI